MNPGLNSRQTKWATSERSGVFSSWRSRILSSGAGRGQTKDKKKLSSEQKNNLYTNVPILEVDNMSILSLQLALLPPSGQNNLCDEERRFLKRTTIPGISVLQFAVFPKVSNCIHFWILFLKKYRLLQRIPCKYLINAWALNNENRGSWVGGCKRVWGNTTATTEGDGERRRQVENEGDDILFKNHLFISCIWGYVCVCAETCLLTWHDLHSSPQIASWDFTSFHREGNFFFFFFAGGYFAMPLNFNISRFKRTRRSQFSWWAFDFEVWWTVAAQRAKKGIDDGEEEPWKTVAGVRICDVSGRFQIPATCKRSLSCFFVQPSPCPHYDLTPCTHLPTSIYTYSIHCTYTTTARRGPSW